MHVVDQILNTYLWQHLQKYNVFCHKIAQMDLYYKFCAKNQDNQMGFFVLNLYATYYKIFNHRLTIGEFCQKCTYCTAYVMYVAPHSSDCCGQICCQIEQVDRTLYCQNVCKTI